MAHFPTSVRRGLVLALLALVPATAASAQVARPAASSSARARGVRPPSLVVVHDGHGLVTVMTEEASIHEVLYILSRWFGFPIANLEKIPDTRGPMRYERVPVAQVIDGLLRRAGLNYVILTNPNTLVPTKVVAGPRLASAGGYQNVPRGLGAGSAAPLPGVVRGADGVYRPVGAQPPAGPAAYDRPFRIEDLPVPPTVAQPSLAQPTPSDAPLPMPDASAGVPQLIPLSPPGDTPLASTYQPPAAGSLPGTARTPGAVAPGASRPGVVVPPAPSPPGKPPGAPDR